jgi:hypothetical protein
MLGFTSLLSWLKQNGMCPVLVISIQLMTHKTESNASVERM